MNSRSDSIPVSPDHLYWDIFPAPAPGLRPRDLHRVAIRATLDELFQRSVPELLENLAAAYALDGDRIIACGIPLDRLGAILQESPDVLSVHPEALPPELGATNPAIRHELNFLRGQHEPRLVKEMHDRRFTWAMLSASAAIVLLAIGLFRRAVDEEHTADLLRTRTVHGAQQLTGREGTLNQLRTTLDAERRSLIATRSAAAHRSLPQDAAQGLLAVLRVWPGEIDVRTQSLSATVQGVTIGAEVPDQNAASSLARALAQADGWTLQTPRTHASGKMVRIDASLQRRGGS